MSHNGTLSSGVVRPFKSLEQIENDQQAARQPCPSTVADRLRMALNDYSGDKRALNRVLRMCHGKNVLPSELVERKVSELIEKTLLQQIAYITRDTIDDLRRVDA